MATALKDTTRESIDNCSKRIGAKDEHQDVGGSELETEHASRNERKHDTRQANWARTTHKKGEGLSSRQHPDGPTPHTDVASDRREDLRTVRQQEM